MRALGNERLRPPPPPAGLATANQGAADAFAVPDPLEEPRMLPNELIARWKHEEQQPLLGWDFSYLANRLSDEQPPWSYATRAAELLQHASSVVDMDTGGGERLLELRDYWPQKVVATERYPPNFELAAERLVPLGVQVVDVELTNDGPMPFASGTFDLVLNRHAGFNPAEVARILAPGGTFLTQQVHGRSLEDLMAVFGAQPQWPNATPENYLPQLNTAGLTIAKAQAWSGRFAFTDVGAIVYYLKHVPWLVPDFSVERYADRLLELQRQVDRGEPLAFVARNYLIEAHKDIP
jgi:SAM-dependent methyltransferase